MLLPQLDRKHGMMATYVQILALSLTSCVTVGKLLNSSVPQAGHSSVKWDNCISRITWLLQRLKDFLYEECFIRNLRFFLSDLHSFLSLSSLFSFLYLSVSQIRNHFGPLLLWNFL